MTQGAGGREQLPSQVRAKQWGEIEAQQEGEKSDRESKQDFFSIFVGQPFGIFANYPRKTPPPPKRSFFLNRLAASFRQALFQFTSQMGPTNNPQVVIDSYHCTFY